MKLKIVRCSHCYKDLHSTSTCQHGKIINCNHTCDMGKCGVCGAAFCQHVPHVCKGRGGSTVGGGGTDQEKENTFKYPTFNKGFNLPDLRSWVLLKQKLGVLDDLPTTFEFKDTFGLLVWGGSDCDPWHHFVVNDIGLGNVVHSMTGNNARASFWPMLSPLAVFTRALSMIFMSIVFILACIRYVNK